MTDRRNGESPVDWSPDPFPSTNHDSRDGITQNIQSHRPNRSTLDRSLSNAIVRSRARARASSRRSSRAMTRPRRRWADTIFPKPFRSSSPRARADRIVPRRPSHDHRARRSYLPRARSPVRVVPRDASREGRRPPSIDEKKHCTYLDLGRLEGGDAADEGGSEESGHCSRVQEWRPKRARGRGRVGSGPTDRVSDRPRVRPTARDDRRSGSGSGRGPPRGTRCLSHDSSFPANHARRARPRSISPARPSPFLHTRTMSALLASSFVGRVAAFKATKVQVRIVFL